MPHLGPWIDGRSSLEIAPACQVSIRGRSRVYEEAIKALTGPELYRQYANQFRKRSGLWVGIGAGLLVISAFVIGFLRRRELEKGSEPHGRWLRWGLRGASTLSVLVFGVISFFVWRS